jgi:hypothetical protein
MARQRHKKINLLFEEEEGKPKRVFCSSIMDHRKRVFEAFGFHINKKRPKWENAKIVFYNMKVQEYQNRPHQMSFHNLCQSLKPPDGIGVLLGLELKFCIQEPRPKQHLLDITKE